MPSTDEPDRDDVVIATLAAQVDEELLLLSHAEAVVEDNDIEIVEYEVTLNSLHRAIHVVDGSDGSPSDDGGLRND